MLARRFLRSSQPLLCLPRQMTSRSSTTSRKPPSPPKPSQPREFPSSGYEVIHPSERVEEERLPSYQREAYYPMRIGDVLEDRYQVVAKLGYGSGSTVWLSRDLREHKYWTLKVHTNTLQPNRELDVYRRLFGVGIDHPGREYVRQFQDSFKVKGPDGEHDVVLMTPLGMSLRNFQELQKDNTFQQIFVARALDQVLLGLNFLHEADVIHTDLHSDNLLIAIADDSILSGVEEGEIQEPSARKKLEDTTIYVSRDMLGIPGPLTICDFGQARIGRVHRGNAMPVQYRAPEVILGMTWGSSVDVWSVGLLAWDLLERGNLFHVYDEKSEELNDAHHLAAMMALLGPPPPEFLKRSEETRRYWDEDGEWHGPVPLPLEHKLDSLASSLSGHDKDLFINFLQCILTWLPEDRLTTLEAYSHPWLRGEGGSPQSENN